MRFNLASTLGKKKYKALPKNMSYNVPYKKYLNLTDNDLRNMTIKELRDISKALNQTANKRLEWATKELNKGNKDILNLGINEFNPFIHESQRHIIKEGDNYSFKTFVMEKGNKEKLIKSILDRQYFLGLKTSSKEGYEKFATQRRKQLRQSLRNYGYKKRLNNEDLKKISDLLDIFKNIKAKKDNVGYGQIGSDVILQAIASIMNSKSSLQAKNVGEYQWTIQGSILTIYRKQDSEGNYIPTIIEELVERVNLKSTGVQIRYIDEMDF